MPPMPSPTVLKSTIHSTDRTYLTILYPWMDSTRRRSGAPNVQGRDRSFIDHANMDSSSRQSASGMQE